jgi:hypothetical protein
MVIEMANSIVNGSEGNMPNAEMLQQIKQFGQNFKGNPKQIVMNMVSQGMKSNQQLQQAMQMARQIQNMLK